MPKAAKTYAYYKDRIAIDPDNIDEALEAQAELYSNVAERHAELMSERDALSLELEEFMADLDAVVREKLNDSEDKVTESMVKNAIKKNKDVKEIRGELAIAKRAVEKWSALKSSYEQRAKMLREIVAWRLGEMYNLGVERGVAGGKSKWRDAAVRRAEELREGVARYRRSDQ